MPLVPKERCLGAAVEVVDVQVDVPGQQVSRAQRNQAHGHVRAGELLSHYTHGAVPAAHQDDVGPACDCRLGLRVPGVLGSCIEEEGGFPAGGQAGALDECTGFRRFRLDRVHDHGHLLLRHARMVRVLLDGAARMQRLQPPHAPPAGDRESQGRSKDEVEQPIVHGAPTLSRAEVRPGVRTAHRVMAGGFDTLVW
ncbi:hypothetical protein D9M72_410800 [compost metagenome]